MVFAGGYGGCWFFPPSQLTDLGEKQVAFWIFSGNPGHFLAISLFLWQLSLHTLSLPFMGCWRSGLPSLVSSCEPLPNIQKQKLSHPHCTHGQPEEMPPCHVSLLTPTMGRQALFPVTNSLHTCTPKPFNDTSYMLTNTPPLLQFVFGLFGGSLGKENLGRGASSVPCCCLLKQRHGGSTG